tara:strand:- start:171 stop:998 length:828 start_codon:yes stop_codon:yes gene_type:complete
MHEVIFKGGLGNQLFCLLQAYKLLFKNNSNVFLNLTNYSLTNRDDRSFLLKSLFPSLFDEFQLSTSFLSKLLYFYSKIFERIFIENDHSRLPGDKSFEINYFPNRYLYSGYFQKFIDSKLEKKSIDIMKKNFSKYISKKKNNNLAIHLRRGDYLSKRHSMHGIVHEKYIFEESKNLFMKNDFSGVTIFSDSPELLNLHIFRDLHENISIDKSKDTLDVFINMANHKGLIASNSTFSLWAGILGDIKIFTIPYYWMKNIRSSLIGLDYIPRYFCKL